MSYTPNLEEKDARALTRHIVTELRAMGASVTNFGVHLDRDGFTFLAEIGGTQAICRTGQGTFTYRAVAAELLHEALTQEQACPKTITN
jgi:hypothetical protein